RRRGAEPRSPAGEQPGPPRADRRQGRPVVEDRFDELLQGLRGDAEMTAALLALFLFAQSPNTSTIVVIVSDQSGAAVPDATVEVANEQTGDSRTFASGSDGSASFPALSLTGTYTVSVSKPGFATEKRGGVALRSGETATLRVKLQVGGAQSEVTVYGTAEGVRADPQIGDRLDGRTVDETPILGRKITTLPLLNSAFRQGKGTGDLFV